jgi:hypothetical protein
MNVFSTDPFEQLIITSQPQTPTFQNLPHHRRDGQGMGLPVLGHRNRQDAAREVNLLAGQLPAFIAAQAREER